MRDDGKKDDATKSDFKPNPNLVHFMITLGFSAAEAERAVTATRASTEAEVHSKAQPWSLNRRIEANKAEFAAEREIVSFDHMDMDGYALRWGSDKDMKSASLQECGKKCREYKPVAPCKIAQCDARDPPYIMWAWATSPLPSASWRSLSFVFSPRLLRLLRSACRADFMPCNVFVFCPLEMCFAPAQLPPGSRLGWCWLKNQPDPNAPHINMNGTDRRTQTGFVEWQAGVVVRRGSRVRTDVKSARAAW